MSRRLALSLALTAALAVGGCGVGAGPSAQQASLVVTRDFGTRAVLDTNTPRSGGSDTVMRLLQRNLEIQTRDGGGFVQAIDGAAGGRIAGRPVDWFYYVNGVEAERGAASVKVKDGDTIWWDRHDWGATQSIPAVVGSFPEPFLHGTGTGRRLPVRVECAVPDVPVCATAQEALSAVGVPAFKGGIQSSFTKQTLRVLVGTYEQLRGDEAVRSLERGPAASGVYARPRADGRSIAILDPRGRTTRTLGAGTGLVAATRFEGGQPVWVVTGTDDAGVRAAASALDPGDLQGHFALAVSDGRAVPAPAVGAR